MTIQEGTQSSTANVEQYDHGDASVAVSGLSFDSKLLKGHPQHKLESDDDNRIA